MSNAPAYTSYAPTRTGPRIGEWLSESFTLFGREWKTWALQGLIFLFLGMGPVMVGVGFYYAGIFGMMLSTPRRGSLPPSALAPMLAGFGALMAGSIVSSFIVMFLMVGMKRTAAKQLRGEPIAVADLFSGGDVYLSVLGASILSGIIVGIGFIFCAVPGLLLAGLLCFTLPILVEERIGVIEAMRKSWEATAPHMWMYLVWYFVVTLVMSVGAFAFYAGYIATVPIYTIAVMIAYRDVFGMEGAVGPADAIPTVPQAQAVNYGPAGPPVAGARCPACGRPVAVGAVMCPHCHAQIPSGYA